MDSPILVGDVGGTNVRFALALRRGGALRIERFEVLQGKSFPTFEHALHRYLEQSGVRATQACFAMAGPVSGNTGRLTNREWEVSGESLAAEFGLSDVMVINDFRAMARSVPELAPDAFEVIFEGEPVVTAPIIVAGPGTGFGVSTLIPSGTKWIVISGEGGHIAYAPRTEIERDLTRLLAREHGYVSNELVASGSGLDAMHAAFCEMFGRKPETVSPAEMRARSDAGDEMYRSLIEVRALAVMGGVGDLALINGALGGVVLAGGVSERIADFLRTPAAYERFVSRGPMSDYLRKCPVRLLHDPVAPLIGAAAHFEQSKR
jgi:glucokinase